MKFIQLPLVATFVAMSLVVLGAPANSRPSPDRTGICYFFRKEASELTQTCVVSSGYGAGGHYAVLRWSDGVQTNITKINFCPQQNYDKNGFCKYTLDEREAKPYQRNVFFKPTTSVDADNLDCYRVKSTGNSVCYRFNK